MTQIKQRNLWDKTWKDKAGYVVLWQNPNIPLWLWIFASILKIFIKHGYLMRMLDVLALGSLFTWAYLELADGVNYFRRILGAGVLIYIIFSRTLA